MSSVYPEDGCIAEDRCIPEDGQQQTTTVVSKIKNGNISKLQELKTAANINRGKKSNPHIEY